MRSAPIINLIQREKNLAVFPMSKFCEVRESPKRFVYRPNYINGEGRVLPSCVSLSLAGGWPQLAGFCVHMTGQSGGDWV